MSRPTSPARFAPLASLGTTAGALAVAAAAFAALVAAPAQASEQRQVDVRGARSAAVPMESLRAVVGEYVLSDGRLLSVQRQGRRLYATVGDERVARAIVAVTATEFESADGRWQLRFDAAPNGLVSGVTVSHPARTQAAAQAAVQLASAGVIR